MQAGFHTAALGEHDLATAGAVLRQLGYRAVGMRLSLPRLDPLADRNVQIVHLEMAASGRRELQLVVDADGPYLIDPWVHQAGGVLGDGEETRRRHEYLTAAVEMVAELGGGVLTYAVGPLPEELGVEAALEQLAATALELAAHGEAVGVDVAVRPRAGHFVDSVGRFERLVEWADRAPRLRMAGDVGTMVGGGEMPVVDLLGRVADRLAAVFLSDVRWVGGNGLEVGNAGGGNVGTGSVALGTSANSNDPGTSGPVSDMGEAMAAEPWIGTGHVSAARVVRGLREQNFGGPVLVEPAEGQFVTPAGAGQLYRAIFGG